MPLPLTLIDKLIFLHDKNTLRFTQDSPIYPDVWMEYFKHASQLDTYRMDLILTPYKDATSAELFMELAKRREKIKTIASSDWQMASNGESVVVCLSLFELIEVVLPLTKWWNNYLWDKDNKPTPNQVWLQQLVGAILSESDPNFNSNQDDQKLLESFRQKFAKRFQIEPIPKAKQKILLWSVSRNRPVSITIEKSVACTKADAGRRLFEIDGADIAWAVLDTGIDARHMAFRKKDSKTCKPFKTPFGDKEDKDSNRTRIVATYDFSRFRQAIVSIQSSKEHGTKEYKKHIKGTSSKHDKSLSEIEVNDSIAEIDSDLKSGRMLDWSVISPLLRIPHNDTEYIPPVHPHGTHVAGILAAGLQDPKQGNLIGMCPAISVYDIRILDEMGNGQEFNILAAIQFLRWLNGQREEMLFHGANFSFSMQHEVESYGCGQTPVCLASEKLVADGVVVVAAAGNLGQAMYQSGNGSVSSGFRMVNITDPGNAEDVITVGATHRSRPHSYGVSYFSSKGPTGDGRLTPDLVAPGEKIVSTSIDGQTERMDGTSMAAPHVSGAAALLLARNRELIGKPRRVKEILCNTAIDLGREKYFQGHGMVDVLKAIQSI